MGSECQNPTRAYSQLETEWVGVWAWPYVVFLIWFQKSRRKTARCCLFAHAFLPVFELHHILHIHFGLLQKYKEIKKHIEARAKKRKKTYFGHFVSSLFGIEPHDRQNADFLQNEN